MSSNNTTKNLLKTAFFGLLIPGTLAGLIPYVLLPAAAVPAPLHITLLRSAAVLAGAAGLTLMLWSAVDFAVKGRGTPAPIDPPKELVVGGPYRWTRNPMYVGVLCLILAEAVFFGSLRLVAYAAVLLALFHTFVALYEEPALTRKFGEAYTHYRDTVPRWLPMPWHLSGNRHFRLGGAKH